VLDGKPDLRSLILNRRHFNVYVRGQGVKPGPLFLAQGTFLMSLPKDRFHKFPEGFALLETGKNIEVQIEADYFPWPAQS